MCLARGSGGSEVQTGFKHLRKGLLVGRDSNELQDTTECCVLKGFMRDAKTDLCSSPSLMFIIPPLDDESRNGLIHHEVRPQPYDLMTSPRPHF